MRCFRFDQPRVGSLELALLAALAAVPALAARALVLALAPDEAVPALVALELVLARPAADPVVATAAPDPVLPLQPDDHIVEVGAGEPVGVRRADDRRRPPGAKRWLDRDVERVVERRAGGERRARPAHSVDAEQRTAAESAAVGRAESGVG